MNKQNLFIILTWIIVGYLQLVAAQEHPNVIIVITDDQGYGDIAAHGHPYIQTPNLDLLHSQSVRLTDFHVSPKCAPTRAALMTGLYSRRAGVWHTVAGVSLMRPEFPTIPEIFRDAGYRTGMYGKWHLGENYPLRPHDRGFEEVFWHKGGGVGQGPDYWGNDYGQFSNNNSRDTYFRRDTPETVDGYCTDVWFREAMNFIEANKDTSFFVYLSTNAPHGPYRVDSKYSSLYSGSGGNANFLGMITNIDENMGLLMDKLEELSISDNTILIFMSDNGSASPTFNAGMRSMKSSVYDGGHRVPFFLRWPGGNLNHGQDVDFLTNHFDVLPTLVELAGLNLPGGHFDGMDFSHLLAGGTEWPERKIIVETQSVQVPYKYNGPEPTNDRDEGQVVMTKRWRWANYGQLYDMEVDPGQQHNVAAQHPDVMAELEQAYEEWWDDVSTRDQDYVEMGLGSPHENPTRLMSHDWHPDAGQLSVWNQGQVNTGQAKTGWWSVNVVQSGTYKIGLRRWPEERPGPMQFGSLARLKIGDEEYTQSFSAQADEVVEFELDLEAGSTTLQGWLDNNHGAYYVYIHRLTGCLEEGHPSYDSTATVHDPDGCEAISIKPSTNPREPFRLTPQYIALFEEDDYTISIFGVNGARHRVYHHRRSKVNWKLNPGLYIVHISSPKHFWAKKLIIGEEND